MSWGLSLSFLNDELPEEFTTRRLGPGPPTPPPAAPSASLNVTVMPRNTKVAVLCGCTGRFTRELIPADYCDFYLKPHLVNIEDHTVTTYKPLGTFTEALWEGYNICTRQILNNDHLTDCCLAMCQQYIPSCFRISHGTVKSVKNILLFVEQFKISGGSTACCTCPKNTARPDSPIFCFTCMQLHCEVTSMHLESIKRHLSYQNQANGNFTLNAIPSPVDVNFFKDHLSSTLLFLKLILCTTKLIYLHRWNQMKIRQPKI